MRPGLYLAPAPSDPVPTRPNPPIRVVVADDHAMLRRSLRLLLKGEEDFEVVGEAGDLASALRHVQVHRPHVLLLDVSMPNGSISQVIQQVRQRAPDTAVVVLTMERSPFFAKHVLEAGAAGFVLKDRADVELASAIRSASRGRLYESPAVAANLVALERSISAGALTEREAEVVRLIALGYTAAEIAGELHLSKRTVETHRVRIQRKLGTRTRRELVSYALRHGLLVG